MGYSLEMAARIHQDDLLREARQSRLAHEGSKDGHSGAQHQLVTILLTLLLGTAMFLV
jgi:hypothetical protein